MITFYEGKLLPPPPPKGAIICSLEATYISLGIIGRPSNITRILISKFSKLDPAREIGRYEECKSKRFLSKMRKKLLVQNPSDSTRKKSPGPATVNCFAAATKQRAKRLSDRGSGARGVYSSVAISRSPGRKGRPSPRKTTTGAGFKLFRARKSRSGTIDRLQN